MAAGSSLWVRAKRCSYVYCRQRRAVSMAAGSNLWMRANGVATFIVASGEKYQWQLAAICGCGPMM